VSVTATANAGAHFVGFTIAGAVDTGNPLTLTADADHEVVATFALDGVPDGGPRDGGAGDAGDGGGPSGGCSTGRTSSTWPLSLMAMVFVSACVGSRRRARRRERRLF
jgi:hypothetical protein